MPGLSTCWLSRTEPDGEVIAAEIAKTGARFFEIDYRLSEKTVESLLLGAQAKGLIPLSVHAVAPAPADKKYVNDAGADAITSEDENERKKGIELVAGSIRLAKRVGAKCVVLHAGQVPMEKATLELQKIYAEGKTQSVQGMKLLNAIRIERLAKRGRTFDVLLKSLDELTGVAEKEGINLAVENRYYYREYPAFEELAIIFLKFGKCRLGYWHDTGHAKVQANLGIVPHQMMLEEFADHIFGMHLHDVDGYGDHLPIPSGGKDPVDFDMVKTYAKEDTIFIIEPRGSTDFADVKKSVNSIRSAGFVNRLP